MPSVLTPGLLRKLKPNSEPEIAAVDRATANCPRKAAGSVAGTARPLPRSTGRPVAAHRTVGSSLKLCLLAEGLADVYPRFGRTMEWDTAAGDAVLRAAGGVVRTLDGAPLAYGKPGFENPDFAAWGTAPA